MRREDCLTCMDAGLVEVTQGKFKTLAYCYCRQGRKWPWTLERIPLAGFNHGPLNWREYKSANDKSYKEKIAWHLERVKNAEAYWAQESARKEGE